MKTTTKDWAEKGTKIIIVSEVIASMIVMKI